jgi:hypothetical protein
MRVELYYHEIPIAMTIDILGCGPSGQFYKPSGNRLIGVNDSYKYGHPLSDLIIINAPLQFELQRLSVILETKPGRFLTLDRYADSWRKAGMQEAEIITPVSMPGVAYMRKDGVYFTNNSPFVAMTYAVTQGATEVVLWGVDFAGHRFLRFQDCAPDFTKYAQWARANGIKIFKGHKSSGLVLEIYNP